MKTCTIIFTLLLLNSITSFSQAKDAPVIKAWGFEQLTMGGAPPPPHQKNIDLITHSFFLETKQGVKVKVVAVWIGKTAFAVVEEPQPTDAIIDLANTNTVLQVSPTDTLKASKTQPSNLLGNEAVIVYQLKGKTYYAPIKTLQHKHINLP